MASIKVYPGDDIIKQLQQMADIDNIAPKCISAAAPVVKKPSKNLKSHRKTGDMEKSITNTKPKKTNRVGTQKYILVVRIEKAIKQLESQYHRKTEKKDKLHIHF